jgi:hypothetical protein
LTPGSLVATPITKAFVTLGALQVLVLFTDNENVEGVVATLGARHHFS